MESDLLWQNDLLFMPCSVALADFLIHSPTFLVTAITRRSNQSHATDFGLGGGLTFLCGNHQNCVHSVQKSVSMAIYGMGAHGECATWGPAAAERLSTHPETRQIRTLQMSTTCPVHVEVYLRVRLKVRKWFTVPTRECRCAHGLEIWFISHYRLFKTWSADKRHLIQSCSGPQFKYGNGSRPYVRQQLLNVKSLCIKKHRA